MRVLKALAIGVLVTFVLFGLALVAAEFGQESLASFLTWQNTLLQSLAPLGNIGTADHPVYEGTPLNLLAGLLSFPLGFAIYGCAAFYWLGRRRVEA